MFFPLSWIKRSRYHYIGKPPKLCDFFEFEDSARIRNEKQHYIKSRSSSLWMFNRELVLYSHFRSQTIAENCLKFVCNSLVCQEKFCEISLKSNISPMYVHPFNPPLLTRAGYAFKLLGVHSENLSKVCVVSNSVPMQSSKGELEFCFFKKWLNPDLDFKDSWSTNGQQHFKESIPDLYCLSEKKAYFWNGCVIHGHPIEQCLFERKVQGKKIFEGNQDTAYKNFEKKCEMLKKNNSTYVNAIETVWQCQWEKQKKEDSLLQHFLQNVYRHPPLYRLDPESAGK